MTVQSINYQWRGDFTNDEVNALHAEAFEHRIFDDDWQTQLERYSLGWVIARDASDTDSAGTLIGFVKVIWDGGVHAFVLDTAVATRAGRQGIGTHLVEIARDHSKEAGCEWLHVDFDDHLADFYFTACGFESTQAGLIQLK